MMYFRLTNPQNWSDRPFLDSVKSWYWGHGRLGSYSIVWFSSLVPNGTATATYVSSYVARDDEVLVASCNTSVLTVIPIGAKGTTGGRYPPHAGDVPDGFQLEFDLGEDHGSLKATISAEAVVAGDGKYYIRWTGNATGEIVGGTTPQSSLDGVAVFEQFALLD